MRLFYYIITSVISIKYRGRHFHNTDIYNGWKMYQKCRRANKIECKSFWVTYNEANRLAKYWKCFPDLYFNYGMFRKEYDDFEQIKSFIPQQAYAHYAKDLDSRYHILIDDKILFHTIMRMYDIPVPQRYFVFQDKEFRRNGQIISDQEVDEIISSCTDDRIFVKRFRGGAASGVYIAVREKEGYYTTDGKKLSSTMIREHYGNSNYIFEKQLIQENVLKRFNPDTVNTIRITTYKNKPVSAAVRFGLKGAYVDNLHAGGIGVSVDIKTGELGDYGARNYDPTVFYEHPSSGVPFKGTKVPGWNEILALVKRTMRCLPYYKSVGFDIVTTDNGPVIIEINTGCGMDIAQMGKKYGIADKFVRE